MAQTVFVKPPRISPGRNKENCCIAFSASLLANQSDILFQGGLHQFEDFQGIKSIFRCPIVRAFCVFSANVKLKSKWSIAGLQGLRTKHRALL
jgi:hypothetical protein